MTKLSMLLVIIAPVQISCNYLTDLVVGVEDLVRYIIPEQLLNGLVDGFGQTAAVIVLSIGVSCEYYIPVLVLDRRGLGVNERECLVRPEYNIALEQVVIIHNEIREDYVF